MLTHVRKPGSGATYCGLPTRGVMARAYVEATEHLKADCRLCFLSIEFPQPVKPPRAIARRKRKPVKR